MPGPKLGPRKREIDRPSPYFPSPGDLAGALTTKQTQAIEYNERWGSKGDRRELSGRTRELGLPEEVGTGQTRCEFHRLDGNSTKTTPGSDSGLLHGEGFVSAWKSSHTVTLTHIYSHSLS